MINIKEALFLRLGYSGDDTFAEVEVRADGFTEPLIVTFKQEVNGRLMLVNVTEKDSDSALDWYDNNLHDAFPSAMDRLFGAESDGGEIRRTFEEQVLSFGDIRETIEDAIYYGT